MHPRFPDKLWCTKGKHWVGTAVFGTLLTCDICQATDRACTARLREQQLAQEGQLSAMQLAAQIGLDNPQVPPPPINHNHPEPPPAIPPPICPLSAVSAKDKVLLENCQNKLMNITMDLCDLCHEEWFDLKVENGVYENCGKGSKFQLSNNMYPGDGISHLPELTQMEEMLISPVHALV